MSHSERLARAQQSLIGLSVGDSLGGFFEMSSSRHAERTLNAINLFPAPWRFTDDTNMALSIYSVLRQFEAIDQDKLVESFAAHFEPGRGYGMGARRLLSRIQQGGSWRELAPSMFGRQGSFGNGSAMRVAPIGAYFADDQDALTANAGQSSIVTHAHPEGIAGAIAVAHAAGQAWRWENENHLGTHTEFIDAILPCIPQGDVHAGVRRARDLAPDTPIQEAAYVLGNGSRVSCQDSVPLVLWVASTRLDNYEEAITTAIKAGGDVDTIAAMVGGIVVMHTGIEAIPHDWRAKAESLPAWAFEETL